MTIRKALYHFLDDLPECNISGWELHDKMLFLTGKYTYPETLLKSCRVYADASGAEFTCIDRARSLYHYKPGYKIATALGGKE